MKSPKVTFYLRWYREQVPQRFRTRKKIRLGYPVYDKGLSLGFVEAMGWERDKFVLDLG